MSGRKKVLVITGTSFRNDTNNGKTLEVLFSKFKPDEIAQIYFSPEVPNSTVCDTYYRVCEKHLLKSFFGLFANKCGGEVRSDPSSKKAERYNEVILHNKRNPAVLFLRELIWDISYWKNHNLKAFLDKVSPTVIFAFLPGNKKTANFISWVAERYGCKVVMLVTDDHYNDYELNPSFIRRRRYRRMQKAVDRAARHSDIILGCSELTAQEYGERFRLPYEPIFTPSAQTHLALPLKEPGDSPVIFRFFGNVGLERWKVLRTLGEAIRDLNGPVQKAKLEIYTSCPDREIIREMTVEGGSEFKGFVHGEDFLRLLADADVAVHAESFDPQMMRYTRLSVSTKIADYLGAGKCILAVGSETLASIAHTAPVSMAVTRPEDLPAAVETLVGDPLLRSELQEKARALSFEAHDMEKNGIRIRNILFGE